MRPSNKNVFWISVSFFTVVYVISTFLVPLGIHRLYHSEHFSLLNQILRVTGDHSLAYYLGRSQDMLWGPLSMICSGMILWMIANTFLQNSSTLIFSLTIFLYFVVTKFNVLFFPPYGDSASGPFMEGLWLARHGFDYVGLAQQPIFDDGGPKVYLFSIYPTFLGLMMKLIPVVKWQMAVHHLLVFMMGAMVIALLKRVFQKVFSQAIASGLALLCFSFPLFQSQVEQINMEMPMLFFGMLSIYFLTEKRIGCACLMALLAVMIKGVGIFFCATFIFAALCLYVFDQNWKGRPQVLLYVLFTLVVSAAMFYGSFYILNKGGQANMVGMFSGWRELKKLPVPYLYGVSLLLFVVIVLYNKIRLRRTFSEILQEFYVPILFFVSAAGWFGVFINSLYAQYRYRLVLTPFLIFCVFFVMHRLIPKERFWKIMLCVVMIMSLGCSYGLMYKMFYPFSEVLHSAIERTLEYRNDMKVHQELAQFLEKNYSDYVIVAPFTVAHKLAFPELGYVTKSLAMYMYEFPSRYDNIKTFKGLKDLNLIKTIWVGFKAIPPPYAVLKVIEAYPFGPQDKIIHEIEYGDIKATLFMGGIYVERARLMYAVLRKYLREKTLE